MIATRTFEELIAENQELAKTFDKVSKETQGYYYSSCISLEILSKILDKVGYIDNEYVAFILITPRSCFSHERKEVFSYHFFKDGAEVATYCPLMNMSPLCDGIQFVNRWHPFTDKDLGRVNTQECELRRVPFYRRLTKLE
jgi:hypothetical protein